jgi:hypothetical protein
MKTDKTRNDNTLPVILYRKIPISLRDFLIYARAQTLITDHISVFQLTKLLRTLAPDDRAMQYKTIILILCHNLFPPCNPPRTALDNTISQWKS